jgi:hypothetical protein
VKDLGGVPGAGGRGFCSIEAMMNPASLNWCKVMFSAIVLFVPTPTAIPIDVIHGAPDSVWVIASAAGSIAVAFVTLILAFATISLAFQTKRLAKEASVTISLANRAEQLKFTDAAILHMVEPEMRDALNCILAGRGTLEHRELAKRMFESDLKKPVNERPEPTRSYLRSVGLYDNLFDRISSYSEAGLIDEHLFFSQYNELIIGLYFLLCSYVWKGPDRSATTRITKFATRAFLHFIRHTEKPWLGDDELTFYENKAREYYPNPETEKLLSRARAARNEVWMEVYSKPGPSEQPLSSGRP